MKLIFFLIFSSFFISQAKAITMDAAFFNILQNKSYFYHGDRYFVFKHSHNRIMFVEAGSLKEEKPWLPTPLDAVYKSRKVSASNKIEHQAYAVDQRRYTITTNGYDDVSLVGVGFLDKFFSNPDAIAHDANSSERYYFKSDMCQRTIFNISRSKRVKVGSKENIKDLFLGAPINISAAMVIGRNLVILKGEHIWSYDVSKIPTNLTAGYPKLFKEVFGGMDNPPTISTMLKYASKRLVGHAIKVFEVDSLDDCFKECLNLPFLTCSSINFEQTQDSQRHRCEINQFKERHFPADLKVEEKFVYYEVNWY